MTQAKPGAGLHSWALMVWFLHGKFRREWASLLQVEHVGAALLSFHPQNGGTQSEDTRGFQCQGPVSQAGLDVEGRVHQEGPEEPRDQPACGGVQMWK